MYFRKSLLGFCVLLALFKFWPSDRWLSTAPFAYWPTLANLVLVILLMVWIRRYAILFSALILVLLFTFYIENNRILVRSAEPEKQSIRVLQWNVWGARYGAPTVSAAISKSEPDVVCLNEPKHSLKETRYPRYEKYLGKEWRALNEANVTVLSRFPVKLLEIYKGYGCAGVLVRIDTTPPIELLLLDISPEFDMLRRKTFSQLKNKLTERGRLPAVVTGDFNTASLADSLDPLYEIGYSDAYRVAGSGIAYTWPSFLPMIKIDYILVQKGWKVIHHESGFTRLSDHAWQFADISPM